MVSPTGTKVPSPRLIVDGQLTSISAHLSLTKTLTRQPPSPHLLSLNRAAHPSSSSVSPSLPHSPPSRASSGPLLPLLRRGGGGGTPGAGRPPAPSSLSSGSGRRAAPSSLSTDAAVEARRARGKPRPLPPSPPDLGYLTASLSPTAPQQRAAPPRRARSSGGRSHRRRSYGPTSCGDAGSGGREAKSGGREAGSSGRKA